MKIEITKIDVKAVDERGALHYFSTDRSGEFLLVYRNKGSISGQHYHKGNSANKNPEDMLLVQGSPSGRPFSNAAQNPTPDPAYLLAKPSSKDSGTESSPFLRTLHWHPCQIQSLFAGMRQRAIEASAD